MYVPAWWNSFIFQVLNGRQLSLYLYLIMHMGDGDECHPTTEEIAADLGLASSTMIFEAMNVLVRNGFIRRTRTTLPELGTRRNVYRRPPCEFTVLCLLRHKLIDVNLMPVLRIARPSTASAALAERGLGALLGSEYAAFAASSDETKYDMLVDFLEQRLVNDSQASQK